MAQYVYAERQEVAFSEAALLNDSIPCTKGYVLHQNGSGNLTVRGIVNNPCPNAFARYRVSFKGNVAIPTGGTLGEASFSIAVNGTPLNYTLGASTPAAVEQFNCIAGFGYVDVFRCGYPSVTIENTSATAETVSIRNLVVNVDRVA